MCTLHSQNILNHSQSNNNADLILINEYVINQLLTFSYNLFIIGKYLINYYKTFFQLKNELKENQSLINIYYINQHDVGSYIIKRPFRLFQFTSYIFIGEYIPTLLHIQSTKATLASVLKIKHHHDDSVAEQAE